MIVDVVFGMHQAMTPHPPSVWNATAAPAAALPTLEQDIQVDCAVIGGGFTGLNAARHLSKRGASCCVLEANDAGWGASGRNGGMAVLRYKYGWAELARQHGSEETLLLYRLVFDAVDSLEANVRELGLDGGFARYGHITAAYTPKHAQSLADDVQWLASCANDTTPRLLDKPAAAELIGSTLYSGGYLDPRAAGVHPLQYARELAAALAGASIPIYVNTPVSRVVTDAAGCVLHTPKGKVRAKTVIVASNAYTELFPLPQGLKQRLVPVTTSVVATRTLPDDLYNTLLPQNHLVTDTRYLVNYFRRVPGNRLLFGGRGSLTGKEKPGIYNNLVRGVYDLYPQLRSVGMEHQWSGKVAVTMDNFPHVGQHSDRVFYAYGYGGRGVALTHLLGKLVAEAALGASVNASAMSRAMGAVPFHSYRLPFMNMVAFYYRLRDQLKL